MPSDSLHQEKYVGGRLCICFAHKSLREEILSKTISLNSTDMFPMFIKTGGGLKRLSLCYIFNMRWICSFSSGMLEDKKMSNQFRSTVQRGVMMMMSAVDPELVCRCVKRTFYLRRAARVF